MHRREGSDDMRVILCGSYVKRIDKFKGSSDLRLMFEDLSLKMKKLCFLHVFLYFAFI